MENYYTTNENIFAVKKGMKPKSKDNIYSICGSGDIPFMLIESGSKVLAVDDSFAEFYYAKERINFLKNGDKENFFSWSKKWNQSFFSTNYKKRDEYFSKVNLENIKNNLQNLDLKLGDFFDLNVDHSKFNKVYMSNIFEHCIKEFHYKFTDDFVDKIDNFFDKFDSKTMFYLSTFEKDYEFEKFKNVDFRKSFFLSRMDKHWDTYIFKKK